MPAIRDPERFEKVASGVQSIVLAIAVVVGGIWTLYTFGAQLQVANSRAQLTALERALELKPKVDARLQLAQLPATAAAKYLISGTATIENTGTDAYLATFAETTVHERPITLYSVAFDKSGQEIWTPVSRHDFVYAAGRLLSSAVVDAGTTSTFDFVAAVEQPGLYAAAFAVEVNPDSDLKNLSDAQKRQRASSAGGIVHLSATRHLVVQATSPRRD